MISENLDEFVLEFLQMQTELVASKSLHLSLRCCWNNLRSVPLSNCNYLKLPIFYRTLLFSNSVPNHAPFAQLG